MFKYRRLALELNENGFVYSDMDVILHWSGKQGNPCKSKNYIRSYYSLKAEICVLDNEINVSIDILKFVINICRFIYVDQDACNCTADNVRTVKRAKTFTEKLLYKTVSNFKHT